MSLVRDFIALGVRNPVLANGLAICVVVGGVLATRNLVSETYPEFSLDNITITVPYPGASPWEIEQGVCIKIEEAIRGLTGIKKIYSYARENSALVIARLSDDVTDARLKMLDIKDRIDQIDSFPLDVEKPIISEMLARQPVINIAVYGQAPERTLKELTLEIKNELFSREGISQVELAGIRDDEIAIQLSREALQKYRLGLDQVTAIVARNCLDVPAGTLRTDREELTLRIIGQRFTARQFEDLVLIAQPDGTLVKLGQIATVSDGFEENFIAGRFQGQPAAMLQIFKSAEQDITDIARRVSAFVDKKKRELPPQLHVQIWADNSREVASRLTMLRNDLIQGITLVIISLTLFLNFRLSFYVASDFPFSFAGVMLVMYLFGQSVNMISLFGLIIVSGILVDDAVVMADGFRLRVTMGDTPAQAAVNSATQLIIPVLGASCAVVIAFLPLLFVSGIMGKFIAVLPIVVISAMLFSSLECFCILPSHLQHCLHGLDTSRRINRWRSAVREHIERWLNHFLVHYYRPVIRWFLVRRVLTVSATFALLVVIVGLVRSGRPPFVLLPEIDCDTLRVRVRFPQGIPVERTQEAARRLEDAAIRLNNQALLPHQGQGDLVVRRFSMIGEWSGYRAMEGSNICEIMIELLPAEQRMLDSEIILAEWHRQTGGVPDALSVIFERMQPGPSDKPLEIHILGDDLDQLQDHAEMVCNRLNEYPGVMDIEHDLLPGKREVRVQLKPLAQTLGVNVADLANQLRVGFFGSQAVRVQRGKEEVRVQVRYPDAERKSLSDIENMRIRGVGGNEIPFAELADFQIEKGYAEIRREDGRRTVRITANVDERTTNAEKILSDLERNVLKPMFADNQNLQYSFEGQHAQMVESLNSLIVGSLLSLVGIYALLAGMLRSYDQPLVLMATIPLGFIGAILGHTLGGYDLSIMSLFGLVTLSGVVVKDAIVLLDMANLSIREGKPVFESVLMASEIRFRAVFLTAATTILGLVPMLTERSTQAQWLIPMVVSLACGMIAATLMTLVIIPALYMMLNDFRRFLRWLRQGGEYPSAEDIERARFASDI